MAKPVIRPQERRPIDRREAAQALAKTIAYLNVNRPEDAKAWFRHLARVVRMRALLKGEPGDP